jgi:type I restriction enzyme M protein
MKNDVSGARVQQQGEDRGLKVFQLFKGGADPHPLMLSSKEELAALERQLISKNDRLYVRCQVRQKDILAKPEEIIRQLWISRLLSQYGY